MAKLSIAPRSRDDARIAAHLDTFARRVEATPPGMCPLAVQLTMLQASGAQTCGKCVPCRDGIPQLAAMLKRVVDCDADEGVLEGLRALAEMIRDTSDCAIGYEAARSVLEGLDTFADEYASHLRDRSCQEGVGQTVPCETLCPAHVDVPAYIALTAAGDYAGAVNMVRKDNPFPTACAFVCEHPCETRCRRTLIDAPINIRGIKKFAVDQMPADQVAPPPRSVDTARTVAVIGGGPSGLTCAYFLALMGHRVTVFEERAQLGGMLRYGIPDYRLPQDKLDADIDFILSTGIEVHTGVSIGRDISFAEIENQYDAVYISIGAHNDKKIGIPGEDAVGVHSAVQLLRDIGEGRVPDFKGKRVCVIGGGNVSMDATRTAIRLGASAVTCVYRRRVTDMTALAEEIEEAQSEGCQILSLQAPDHIETDETGRVTALWTRPQVIGAYGKDGRPRPYDADQPLLRTPCDVVIVAIGQSIDAKPFEQIAPVVRGKIQAESDAFVPNTPHVFAGGDAVTGPATVIRAVAAGKVAAANIDAHLGFRHVIKSDVEIPAPHLTNMPACGRIELRSRPAEECVGNFDLVKCGMTEQEVHQETSRCLRCDHFGYGIFKGGRSSKW